METMMLKAEELRRMVAEATPGQWYVSDDWNVSAPGKTVLQGAIDVASDAESEANAALAALAPTLATEHAALQDRVARLEAALDRLGSGEGMVSWGMISDNSEGRELKARMAFARAALAEAAP